MRREIRLLTAVAALALSSDALKAEAPTFEVMGLGGAGGPFAPFSNLQLSGPVISSMDFFWFSIPTIFVTSLISSFIVSVIRTGSKGQGMKYFPFVLLLSYLVYWFVISMVESFFATVA